MSDRPRVGEGVLVRVGLLAGVPGLAGDFDGARRAVCLDEGLRSCSERPSNDCDFDEGGSRFSSLILGVVLLEALLKDLRSRACRGFARRLSRVELFSGLGLGI